MTRYNLNIILHISDVIIIWLLLIISNYNISKIYTKGKLFEVGPQFMGTKDKDQMMVATAIQYGIIGGENWSEESRNFDVFDIKLLSPRALLVFKNLNDVINLLSDKDVSIKS